MGSDEEQSGGEGDGGGGGDVAALHAQEPGDDGAYGEGGDGEEGGETEGGESVRGEIEEVGEGEGVVGGVAVGEEGGNV